MFLIRFGDETYQFFFSILKKKRKFIFMNCNYNLLFYSILKADDDFVIIFKFLNEISVKVYGK